MTAAIPTLAVVGRPNVGKSTLVNRMLGRREAIVEEKPGVTRDRVLYTAEWRGRPFLVVDTGGLNVTPADELAGRVSETAKAAAAGADVIAFVVDVTDGLTAEDRSVAAEMRKLGVHTVLVANKVDNERRERDVPELFELGLGEPHPVSALHGRGMGDLLDVLTEHFAAGENEDEGEPGIAIVGRPNVGKSTLFNHIAGAERSIVHAEPGTTTDSVDTIVESNGTRYRFVDTAGLRRASRVDEPTEYFGTVRTMRALDRSEVAVLVIDATEGISRQDLRIAEEIVELGRSAVVVLNKIDLLDADEIRYQHDEAARRLPHLEFAPVINASGLTGQGVDELMAALVPILKARSMYVPTHLLNAIVTDLQSRTPIPSQGRGKRIRYAVQVDQSPPTIVLFGTDRLPERWRKYLERGLRSRFGFHGTPIRLLTRSQTRKEMSRKRPASRKSG
jgi:GTP-binding protein